jgi:hypothetical protein
VFLQQEGDRQDELATAAIQLQTKVRPVREMMPETERRRVHRRSLFYEHTENRLGCLSTVHQDDLIRFRMDYDASIDLTTDVIPAHVPPLDAVGRVRTAVEKLPGAFWISVEWCGSLPPVQPPIEWVRVYRRHRGNTMAGEPWDTIKADIKATVAAVLGT